MSGRAPRPLAPVPSAASRPDPTRLLPRKRQNTKSACTACKTRKMKCSGESPCENCKQHGLKCEINAEGDQRRKANLKRKLEGLERDRDLLLELLGTIRESENRHVVELMNRIREGADVEDVRAFLDDKMSRFQLERTPELREVYGQVRTLQKSEQRRNMLDVNRLSDVPLFKVPSTPWTDITDDDDLVSHLISMWFTWDAPFFNWVDRELFIKDMQAGQVDCEFCSAFLVNAMLAEACFSSDYPETFAVPDDPVSKGEHFWKEAKRLLDTEAGEITLTIVQGIGVMYSCTCVMGRDPLGWLYILQLAEYVRELRSSQHRLVDNCILPPQRTWQLLDRVQLALFGATTASCLSLQKPGKMDKPSGVRLPTHESVEQDTWVPYPRQQDPMPAHTNCTINSLADVSEVAWDAANLFFGPDGKVPRADLEEAVDGWYSSLLQWAENIPPCMDYQQNPLPGVLTIHMFYHTVIMTIYSFLRVPPPDSNERTVEKAESARTTCLSSALAVSDLIEIQQTKWGPHPMPVTNMQWMVVALFTLTEDLDDPISQADFLKLCEATIYPARRWLLLKGMLRLVQITARQKHSDLPEDIRRFFRDFESKYWKAEDRERFASAYPKLAASIRQQGDYTPKGLERDTFLGQWDEMSITE